MEEGQYCTLSLIGTSGGIRCTIQNAGTTVAGVDMDLVRTAEGAWSCVVSGTSTAGAALPAKYLPGSCTAS